MSLQDWAVVTSPPLMGSQEDRVVVPVAGKNEMSLMLDPEILGCHPLQSHSLKKHQVMALRPRSLRDPHQNMETEHPAVGFGLDLMVMGT